jgi:RNA polymerase sigma factor (sigma-70 family)
MWRNGDESERGLAANSDEYLLSVAKKGEHSAFIELSRRHTPRILRVLTRITKNRDDTEDAMQETLMKAFTHLKTFEGRSSFSTWLTRIAINSALMVLRKERQHREVSFDTDWENDNGSSMQYADLAPNPEYLYYQSERQRRLRDAIQRLPPALRKCIEIQHTREISAQEIANIAGLSIAATKSRLLRARRKVVSALDKKYLIRSVKKDDGKAIQNSSVSSNSRC